MPKRLTFPLITICFELTFRWLTQVSTSEILLTNLCRRHCHAASNSCEKWKSESVKILCILRDLITNPEWKYLQLPTQKYQKDVWRGEGPSRVFHRFADLPICRKIWIPDKWNHSVKTDFHQQIIWSGRNVNNLQRSVFTSNWCGWNDIKNVLSFDRFLGVCRVC